MFFLSALLSHGVFVTTLLFLNWVLSQREELSVLVVAASYSAAAICAVFFYFNPDYFFINRKLHMTLKSKEIQGNELTKQSFLLVKALVWIFVLLVPIVGVTLGSQLPFFVKAYGCMVYVLSLGICSGFLFRGYSEYLELRKNNKWGVLATW
jgi:hypothetical protein